MAAERREPKPIRLPFGDGEHLCTWDVPRGDGISVEVPGLLSLGPGMAPNAHFHGEVPVQWTVEGDSRRAGFPQTHRFETLGGHLASGAHVALLNGELSYWFASRGDAVGAFAVLSREPFTADGHRLYSGIELQIEGLESVAGLRPIASTTHPVSADDEQMWGATLDGDASFSWEHDGVTMSYSFSRAIRSLDAFEFQMAFSPVLRITAEEPLTLVGWWTRWILPLRQLVALVTRAPREIRYVLARHVDDDGDARRDQVFRWDISQQPANSTTAAVRRIRSSVDLSEDNLSLLDLLTAWQRLDAEGHPLIQTFGPMTNGTGQHPRSRFLLLLQALEGSFGFENAERIDAQRDSYTKERSDFLARAEAVLSAEDRKFLRKRLHRWPAQGLDEALTAIFESLPADVVPALERTVLMTNARAELTGSSPFRVQAALVRIRNQLSHGSAVFDPHALDELADVLERIVRSETVRVLGAPDPARVRALQEPDH